jgi:hypothetical protein
MLICRNQSCGASWESAEVLVKNEGQGLMFRCALCGTRNPVIRRDLADGKFVFEQDQPKKTPPSPK